MRTNLLLILLVLVFALSGCETFMSHKSDFKDAVQVTAVIVLDNNKDDVPAVKLALNETIAAIESGTIVTVDGVIPYLKEKLHFDQMSAPKKAMYTIAINRISC